MRSRIIRAVVLSSFALVAITGVAQASMVTGVTSNNSALSGSTAVALSGNNAYVVGYWSGQLSVYDVSNPAASPALIGQTPALYNDMVAATNITISGNYAFVTSKNRNGICTPTPSCTSSVNDDGTGDSLTIVNISNPAAPSIVGTVRDPQKLFGAYAVAVSGNYAFVASEGVIAGQPATTSTSAGSFSVIDISNPLGPTIVANIDNSSLPNPGPLANGLDHATSVAISGNYAYVTAFAGTSAPMPNTGNALTVINISNPTAPSVVASLQNGAAFNAPNDVQISGNYAYVVNQLSASKGLSDFTVVNITNATSPVVVGTLINPMLAGAYRVRIGGNYAYVSANNAATIAAVNISNPALPTLAGATQDTTNLANVTGLAVAASGQYIVASAPRQSGGPVYTYAPYPTPGAGGAPTGTLSIISAATSITAQPSNPTTSTSAVFAFSANDPAATFTCSLDGAAATPCTAAGGANYSSLSLGSHTFTVTGTDSLGLTPASAAYTWTVAPVTTPKNTVAPMITGTTKNGKTLTVSNGTWSNATSFTYAWARCPASGSGCTPIAGQTSSSYKVSAGDVGSRLAAVVTAHNGTATAAAPVGPTGVVSWSTGSFATGSLTHRNLALLVPSPGGGLKLTKLVISLPKGVSFAGSAKSFARALSVKASGHKVKFKVSLSRGSVTITFTTPPTGVNVSVKARFVTYSSSLAQRVSSHKAKSLSGGLSASYQGTPTRRGTVTYKVK